MPALTSITINDGESTPVAHTFVPQSKTDTGLARLVESDGTPIGDNVVTVSLKRTPTKVKARLSLAMPVTVDETVNGVVSPKVVRTAYANIDFSFDPTSSLQERKNLAVLAGNALASGDVFIDAVFHDLEGIY
jgi:hypothetical protein